MLLVDSSGSIYRQNWPTVLDFMKNLVRSLTIGPNNVRVGVAIFGDDVRPMFQLNTYSTQREVLNAIERIPFLDQTTNTPAAIRYMRNVMFTSQNGDRPSAPNSVIIITDGVPRVPTDVNEARRLTLQEANLARSQGINIFTIGIGPELTTQFLAQIADQPTNTHVFQVNQVRELETILNQVASATCNTSPPTPGKNMFPAKLTNVSLQEQCFKRHQNRCDFTLHCTFTYNCFHFQCLDVIKRTLFSWLILLAASTDKIGKLSLIS